jgi:hypothetical protein
VDGVQIEGVIALGCVTWGNVDQTEPGEVVEIFRDTLFAQTQGGRHRGHARPTLPRGAVRIALQHGVNRDANGAHLGGVVVDHAIVEAKGVGAQRDDLCHGTFSFGIRSQMW